MVSSRRNVPDLVGQTFGRLTVLFLHPRKPSPGSQPAIWHCRCECGRTKDVRTNRLINGHTKSCGCLAAELSSERNGVHYLTKTPEYRAWWHMIRRCYEPAAENYGRYGGRGIAVCDRWRFGEDGRHPSECFITDIGLKPTREHSLDRIDPNGDYTLENTRWASKRLQANNKRCTVWVTAFGERMSLADLALRMKVPYLKLWREVQKKGRAPEEALQRLGVRIQPDDARNGEAA